MLEKRLYLLAGLGNPGDIYAHTRHNAGFMIIDHIADSCSININKTRFNANYGMGRIAGEKVILVKPVAFMNRSGPPVLSIAKYFKILISDILIIHDDIDIEFGNFKIKKKGGDGGHKGLRSLIDSFGTRDFCRLRIGIGRPVDHFDAATHVLKKFSSQEKKIIKKIVARAGDVVESILSIGIENSMNRFNVKSNH